MLFRSSSNANNTDLAQVVVVMKNEDDETIESDTFVNNNKTPPPPSTTNCIPTSKENYTITTSSSSSSKREMLSFAIPALGIYLCNPLLSNMDNAFVGQTMGTVGLAALSPATIGIDQMLYLFNFLGRATTGIVTRAYFSTATTVTNDPSVSQIVENDTSTTTPYNNNTGGNTMAARDAASARTYNCVL